MKCEICGHKQGTKRRSVPQHRRFFAMLRAYYHHWPEWHEFQPDNAEKHLRAWALVAAKYRNVVMTSGASKVDIDVPYKWEITKGEWTVVFWPKSICFDDLSHHDACKLFDDVSSVLESETRLKTEDVMRELENAA